jgi:general secretion pathway protein A
MYVGFFGLRERPFDLLPDPRFLFLTLRQREALSNLRYGLSTPRGLTLLLGEAGTGKTTLLQAVLSEAERGSSECVLMNHPTLTREEFYEFLAAAFGLGAEAAASKTRFLRELRRHLMTRHEAGQLSAIVFDEAQSLPYELLEEVRLLGNIETPTTKLLNVVLAGQPELAGRLNEPGLRQLKQRISLRCELGPFEFHETAAYIAGRIRIAGGEPERIFTSDAIATVHEGSGGVPRTVNVICDNALMGGLAAQVKPVTRALVDDICRDFDLLGQSSEPRGSATDRREGVHESMPSAAVTAAATEPAGEAGGARRLFGWVETKRRFSFF